MERDSSDLFEAARDLCVAAAALVACFQAHECAGRMVDHAEELLQERARRLALLPTIVLEQVQ